MKIAYGPRFMILGSREVVTEVYASGDSSLPKKPLQVEDVTSFSLGSSIQIQVDPIRRVLFAVSLNPETEPCELVDAKRSDILGSWRSLPFECNKQGVGAIDFRKLRSVKINLLDGSDGLMVVQKSSRFRFGWNTSSPFR